MTEDETVILLSHMLREQLSFVHVRFGDGDVFFASGTGPVITGDGEEWCQELSDRLNDAWLDLSCPAYLALGDLRSYAVSDGCEEQWDVLVEKLLAVREPRRQPVGFIHMEALRVGFGHALPFYEAVRDDPRDKIFVGPQRLAARLAPYLNAKWLGVSLGTAWTEADYICQVIQRQQPEIVLFAAGRGGKIMQGKLACSMPDMTQIDVGSGLDLLILDGVRRGTDLGIDREAIVRQYREAGLCP